MVGSFKGSVTAGAQLLTSSGNTDVLAARLDSSGKVVWVGSGGGSSMDEGEGVAMDGTRCRVAGTFTGSASFGKTSLTSKGKADVFIWRP